MGPVEEGEGCRWTCVSNKAKRHRCAEATRTRSGLKRGWLSAVSLKNAPWGYQPLHDSQPSPYASVHAVAIPGRPTIAQTHHTNRLPPLVSTPPLLPLFFQVPIGTLIIGDRAPLLSLADDPTPVLPPVLCRPPFSHHIDAMGGKGALFPVS